MAASFMWSGVSKSGSPDPKPTTSIPFDFNELASAVTARVEDGFICPILFENFIITCPDNKIFIKMITSLFFGGIQLN
jgi:hypothetical protein